MAAIHPVRHCTFPCHPGSAAFYEGAREAGEIREGKFNAGYILSDKNCEQTVGWTKSAFADDLLILRILLFAIDVFSDFRLFRRMSSAFCLGWSLHGSATRVQVFFGCAMDAVLFSTSTAEHGFNDEKPECSPARESWHRNVDLDEILYRMIMDDLRHSAWHVARWLLRKNAIFVWMDSII
jgi:hypothetical protein